MQSIFKYKTARAKVQNVYASYILMMQLKEVEDFYNLTTVLTMVNREEVTYLKNLSNILSLTILGPVPYSLYTSSESGLKE